MKNPKKKPDVLSGVLPIMNTCYQCGTAIDGWTGIDGHSPSNGDISVCSACAAILVFKADANMFIKPDDDLIRLVENSPQLVRMRRLVMDVIMPGPMGGWGETVRQSRKQKRGKT